LTEKTGLGYSTLKVDSELVPIISGFQRKSLRNLGQITGTNIYIPSSQKQLPDQRLNTSNTVYITGKKKSVSSTVAKLEATIAQKVRLISNIEAHDESLNSKQKSMVRQVQIESLRVKLDWIAKFKKDALHKIMHDNAVYISIPDSDYPFVSFYGDSTVYIQRAIRMFQDLVCHISLKIKISGLTGI
jgi:hypothetical protein